jgi:hypothetical protein
MGIAAPEAVIVDVEKVASRKVGIGMKPIIRSVVLRYRPLSRLCFFGLLLFRAMKVKY